MTVNTSPYLLLAEKCFFHFRLEKKQMLLQCNLIHTLAAKHKFHLKMYTGVKLKQ